MKWLVLCLFLSGCGLSSLGLLTGGGGGPTVNSNAQIGKENRQAGLSFEEDITAGRDVVSKEIETGSVDQLKILNTNIPPWVIILLILAPNAFNLFICLFISGILLSATPVITTNINPIAKA